MSNTHPTGKRLPARWLTNPAAFAVRQEDGPGRWAVAAGDLVEPTIAVTPIVTSNSEGRHVRFDVAVKGQIGPVSDHLPYESQELR